MPIFANFFGSSPAKYLVFCIYPEWFLHRMSRIRKGSNHGEPERRERPSLLISILWGDPEDPIA